MEDIIVTGYLTSAKILIGVMGKIFWRTDAIAGLECISQHRVEGMAALRQIVAKSFLKHC